MFEQINTPGNAPLPLGKYHVARQIAHAVTAPEFRQLPEAA